MGETALLSEQVSIDILKEAVASNLESNDQVSMSNITSRSQALLEEYKKRKLSLR